MYFFYFLFFFVALDMFCWYGVLSTNIIRAGVTLNQTSILEFHEFFGFVLSVFGSPGRKALGNFVKVVWDISEIVMEWWQIGNAMVLCYFFFSCTFTQKYISALKKKKKMLPYYWVLTLCWAHEKFGKFDRIASLYIELVKRARKLLTCSFY